MADSITYRNVLLLDDDENGLIPYLPPATASAFGVVKANTANGIFMNTGNVLTIAKATDDQVIAKSNVYRPIVPANIDLAVKTGLTANSITLTESEQQSFKDWMGIDAGGSSRNIGEIVTSTVPLADAGLHEMNGEILSGSGAYSDFVDYMIDLYTHNSSAACFAHATTIREYNFTHTSGLQESGGILTNFVNKVSYAFPKGLTINPTLNEDLEICFKIYWPSLVANSEITNTPTDKHGLILRMVNASTGQITIWCSNGSGAWGLSSVDTGLRVVAQAWTWIKIYWSKADHTYNFYSSVDGINWTQGTTQTSKAFVPDLLNYMHLGGGSREAYQLNGQMDLNGCYIKQGSTYLWKGWTDTSYTATQIWDKAITDFGTCSKYLVDTSQRQVRLPLVSSESRKLIYSSEDNGKYVNLYSDGWCEQGGEIKENAAAANAWQTIALPIPYKDSSYISQLTHSLNTATAYIATTGDSARNTKDALYYAVNNVAGRVRWTTYGFVDLSEVNLPQQYQYIVVASTTKTSVQVDIDQISVDLARKVDKADIVSCETVIETIYEDGTYCRVYTDGWCEQGGDVTRTGETQQVYFLKSFESSPRVLITPWHHSNSTDGRPILVRDVNPDKFTLNMYTGYAGATWQACGYVEV